MKIQTFIILVSLSLLAAVGLYVFGMHSVDQLQEQLQESQQKLHQQKELSTALGQALTSNEATISALQLQLAAEAEAVKQLSARDETTLAAAAHWQQKNEELSHDPHNQGWATGDVPADVIRMLNSARAHYRDTGRDQLSSAASGAVASLPDPRATDQPPEKPGTQ